MSTPVLLVGGGNQIAAYLVPALSDAGYPLIVQSRNPAPPWIPSVPELVWSLAPVASGRHRCLIYLAPLQQFEALFQELSEVARVVVFSSTSRFSKAASSDPGERALAEELARYEARIEHLVGAAGADLVILRPTLIYGAGLDQSLTRIAQWIQRRHFMPLVGAGVGKRQPVHAQDLATAVVDLLGRESLASDQLCLVGWLDH